MGFDDNGWFEDRLVEIDPALAYTLFSPDPAAIVDVARWAHQARRFLASALEVHPAKKYPLGRAPERDAFELEIAGARVRVITLPIVEAPRSLEAANAAVRAIGGAGMDALVARAKRVWQIDASTDATSTAPLLAAATLAMVLLAPIVPPDGRSIFGVKGARERLAERSTQ